MKKEAHRKVSFFLDCVKYPGSNISVSIYDENLLALRINFTPELLSALCNVSSLRSLLAVNYVECNLLTLFKNLEAIHV